MGYGSWGPRVGHDWVTNTNLKHSFVTVKNENEIFFLKLRLFNYLATLGLGSCSGFALVAASRDSSLALVCGVHVAVGSLVLLFSWALETMGFSSCGARAYLP